MGIESYDARISLFYRIRPDLTQDELAVLLTVDRLYRNLPDDLPDFRKRYAHLDPAILKRPHEGITFTRVAAERGGADRLRQKLNDYLNIKFHDIKHPRSYAANVLSFKRKSLVATEILDEILLRAALPAPIVEVFREREEVRTCHDFYEMLRLYQRAADERLRYEVLRKLGLIVLIARINRSVELAELEIRKREIWQAFDKRLRSTPKGKKHYFYWLTPANRIVCTTDERRARSAYREATEARRRHACGVLPLQRFGCRPFRTYSGVQVLHMEIRNKFRFEGRLSYTSCVEKMVRKNLEFPNQVHDAIGIKIVVEREEHVHGIIRDLESFLGGSSTRKQEKNTYHRFGKHRLKEDSPPRYFVWKAIYDIPLPHPSVAPLRRILSQTRGIRPARQELQNRLRHLLDNPKDFVIEVQIQDIGSYLLSIARGSPTEHARLKTDQIRSNSFYKFFPSEVYARELQRLKQRLLRPC